MECGNQETESWGFSMAHHLAIEITKDEGNWVKRKPPCQEQSQ